MIADIELVVDEVARELHQQDTCMKVYDYDVELSDKGRNMYKDKARNILSILDDKGYMVVVR